MLKFKCNIFVALVLINVDEKIADDIVFYAAIGGILGSKIYYIIEEKQLYETYILGEIEPIKSPSSPLIGRVKF